MKKYQLQPQPPPTPSSDMLDVLGNPLLTNTDAAEGEVGTVSAMPTSDWIRLTTHRSEGLEFLSSIARNFRDGL